MQLKPAFTILMLLAMASGCGSSYTPSPPVAQEALDDESPAQRKRRLENVGSKATTSAANANEAAGESLRTAVSQSEAGDDINDDESPAQRQKRLAGAGTPKQIAPRPVIAESRPTHAAPSSTDSANDDESPSQRQNRLQLTAATPTVAQAIDGRKVIERLLQNEAPSAQDVAMAGAALQSLARMSSSESDDLLFRVVTADESRDSGPSSQLLRDNLRNLAIRAVRTSGSAALRNRLAEHIVQPNVSESLFGAIWPVLKIATPTNVPAQTIVYASGRLDDASQKALEQVFAVQSHAALDRLLGLPSASQTVNASLRAPTQADDMKAFNEHFQRPELAEAIARRLSRVENMANETPLLSLATSVPNRAVRISLLKLMERHWDEGPASLTSVVLAGATPEPGFLAIVKMLPRKELPEPSRAAGTARRADSRSTTASSVRATAIRQEKQRQDRIASQWMEFCEDVLLAMCRRFDAAGHSSTARPTSVRTDSDEKDVMKPHPNGSVVARYRIDLPCAIHVRYLRLEQRGRPAALVSFYRRQAPGIKEREMDGSIWLDHIEADDGLISVQSLDVVIEKSGAAIGSGVNAEQELVTKILCIWWKG